MSYYDEVFLKRMNKDGRTRQERILTRKEKEFDNIYLKRTQYQSYIYAKNDEVANIVCSLQPNKWNESNLIGNLLISREVEKLKVGDVLHILQKIDKVEFDKIWLILFSSDEIVKGHSLYKCICLDETINITNEYGDTNYNVPAKVINASAQFVKDTFNFTRGKGYEEPNMQRGFVTSNYEYLKKGQYFNHQDKRWAITGKDTISVPGVAYVYFEEKLKREDEPRSSEDLLVGENSNFFLNGR